MYGNSNFFLKTKHSKNHACIGVQVRNSGPGVTLPGDMEKKKRDANLKKGSLEISAGAHQSKNETLCASEIPKKKNNWATPGEEGAIERDEWLGHAI